MTGTITMYLLTFNITLFSPFIMFTFVSFGITALVFYLFFKPDKHKKKPTLEQIEKLRLDQYKARIIKRAIHEEGFNFMLHGNLYCAQYELYPTLIRDWIHSSDISRLKSAWTYDQDTVKKIVTMVKAQEKHGLRCRK